MKLFEPITVGSLVLKNRIVMPAMQVGVGLRSKKAIAYYAERARGGVGTIVVAGTPVDIFVSDDAWGKKGGAAAFLESVKALPEEVHRLGAKIGVQLWHGNFFPAGNGGPDSRGEPTAPSAKNDVWLDVNPNGVDERTLARRISCRALTISEIESIIEKYAGAAAKLKEAGFDFAEIAGQHNALARQFFSPADNHRTDKYGGDLRGRMRFGLECVRAIRSEAGREYPLFYRLPAWEPQAGGITLDDAVLYAKELQSSGVDVLDVSTGGTTDPRGYPYYAVPGPEFPMGTLVHLAEAIKRGVTIPVIGVGRLNTPEVAEQVLSQRRADLVAIGRQLIADPFWPEKVSSGRHQEIVPCLSCNTCLEAFSLGRDFRCSVNPMVGRESEQPVGHVESPQRILVVGGGPAGMEAASVLAEKGHRVTLAEKSPRLGGQLWAAASAPHKDPIARFAESLSRRAARLGVLVKLGREVDLDVIEQEDPDVVVLATGSAPRIPEIRGLDNLDTALATDVLLGRRQVGDRVVVMGGELVGCEIAEYLAAMGKKVTVTRRGPSMATKLAPSSRWTLLQRLAAKKVVMLTGVNYEEITADGLIIRDPDGSQRLLEADTIVLASGSGANDSLARALRRGKRQVRAIGDCVEPRRIVDAIAEGYAIAREL